MSFTWNPRLVKTPTPIISAMTIAVAVDTVARFELPLLAGVIIELLAPWEPAYHCRPLWPQAGKKVSRREKIRRSIHARARPAISKTRKLAPLCSRGAQHATPAAFTMGDGGCCFFQITKSLGRGGVWHGPHVAEQTVGPRTP